MLVRKGFLLVLSLCVSAVVFAQSDEEAAKARRERLNAILAGSLAEVQDLKLPENRAILYARIGSLTWPQDEKRARALFRNAAAELIAAQDLAESKRAVNPYNELLQGSSTRQQILNVIATRDAALALEMLASTRPANLQRAMEAPKEKSQKISNFLQNNAHLIQNEGYMEQNFYRMAAEQSPERAVKILKQSLSKGLSSDTFNQLERLSRRDATVAAEMASQVVDKLLRSTYMLEEQANYVDIQLTNLILSYHISRGNDDDQKLKFDEGQMQTLAAKFVNAYIADQRIAGSIGQSINQIAEKLRPGSLEQIRKINARMYPQNGGSDVDAAYQKIMNGETPVAQMLASADKFPINSRRQIYQTASNRLLSEGNWQAARNVIAENFAADDSDQTLTNFDQQLVYNLTGQGKFAEAESIIDGLPEQQRVALLVNLSTSILNRNQQENRARAAAILGKAHQLVNEKPENSNEMGILMQVINGYGQVDPPEAIRLFEGVIPKLTELTDATAVLNGFQVNSNVRDGEFLVANGSPLDQFGGNSYMLGSFARIDFERTMNLIEAFKRPEIRILLKLQLLDGSELTSMPISGRTNTQLPIVRRGDK
jgi:hypothetical protein